MALVLETALGAHDMGVLHDRQGRLVRFASKEVCEQMASVVMTRARIQHAAGKLDPQITNVHLSCYRPSEA